MAKKKTPETVSDLIPDDKNFNTGNPFGESLIEKSFSKFGAGRGILVDKNNRIIAGNKSTQKFVESGNEKIIVVETTGDTLVVTKRTDIDLDTPQGREMALADNMAASKNITMDAELIEAEVGEAVMVEWGVIEKEAEKINKGEASVKLQERFIVPPFSILDTKQGYWQERKRYWLALGIKSEIGRGGGQSLANEQPLAGMVVQNNLSRSFKNQSGLKKIMQQK